MNPVLGIVKIGLARRFRAGVVWCMIPLALWSGIPIACCYGSGRCEVMAAFLRAADVAGHSCARATEVCSDCCCHENSGHDSTASGRHNCGADSSSQRDKCNCPIMGRDSAIIVTTLVAGRGSNHPTATLVANSAMLMPISATVRLVNCREPGPPLDPLIQFERLLI